MKLIETKRMALDDELPEAPGSAAATAVAVAPVDPAAIEIADVDAAVLDSIPDELEALRGAFHIRLDKYEKRQNEDGPNFNCTFKVQQEPHTGRVIFDTLPWAFAQDIKDANDTSSPRNAEARTILKNRLWKAKQFMKSCGFKGSIETLLQSNPECRADCKPREKMDKNPTTGKYDIPTGKFNTNIDKYLPLV